jgi:Flp pilus assembly CpaF family ATPase
MYSAFDVVIQMRNARDGKRGVAELAELIRTNDGTVSTQPLLIDADT